MAKKVMSQNYRVAKSIMGEIVHKSTLIDVLGKKNKRSKELQKEIDILLPKAKDAVAKLTPDEKAELLSHKIII